LWRGSREAIAVPGTCRTQIGCDSVPGHH
jgi:hypothetical protein